MKKLKVIIPIVIICGFLLTSCSAKNSSAKATEPSTDVTESTVSDSGTAGSTEADSVKTGTVSKANVKTVKTGKNKPANVSKNQSIAEKAKEYILSGQKDRTEDKKLKWSKTFLNQVNADSVYKKYLSTGGKANDVESFAEYMTQNAPVPDNWKKLFETDFSNAYSEKVSKYEPLQDDYYQVYVKKGGSDVRYVVVNAKTGCFHG